MRMWMVNPKVMCNQHLLGEHVECHMFVGAMNKGKNLSGFIKKNLFEPKSLYKRHDELVTEMKVRGMNHKSPLIITPEVNKKYLQSDVKVDRNKSFLDLINRCEKCRGQVK